MLSLRADVRTPVLTAKETLVLPDNIDVNTIAGLRDRALIGVMVQSFARVDAYLTAALAAEDRKGPLFRSLDCERHLTGRRLHRLEVLAMIKRRAGQASLPETASCHTFRATGITAYLQNGGTIEHAQQIGAFAHFPDLTLHTDSLILIR